MECIVIQKPPRAHHCSLCGTCTLKMDHHCFVLQYPFSVSVVSAKMRLEHDKIRFPRTVFLFFYILSVVQVRGLEIVWDYIITSFF